MYILFEALRVNCMHGKLTSYDHGLHACCGAVNHSHLAAPISCRQHYLPNDSYKDALLTY